MLLLFVTGHGGSSFGFEGSTFAGAGFAGSDFVGAGVGSTAFSALPLTAVFFPAGLIDLRQLASGLAEVSGFLVAVTEGSAGATEFEELAGAAHGAEGTTGNCVRKVRKI